VNIAVDGVSVYSCFNLLFLPRVIIYKKLLLSALSYWYIVITQRPRLFLKHASEMLPVYVDGVSDQ